MKLITDPASLLEYEKAIKKLIPTAELYADKHVWDNLIPDQTDAEKYGAVWNSLYHNEMNRLTREAGIRCLK